MLADLLEPNLKLVVCGTASGKASARLGHYYAGRGNRFWRTLFQVGLTDKVLAAHEWRQLRHFGIGLTDLVKGQAGMDRNIRWQRLENLETKILSYRPLFLAFNGKKAAQSFLRTDQVEYGLVKSSINGTRLFVCPSTSAAAAKHWDIEHWVALAGLVQETLRQTTP